MSAIRPLALSVAMAGLAASTSPLFAADEKVASFETGKQGTDQWEALSFWLHADGRKDIAYSHGKDRAAIDVEANALTGTGDRVRLRIVFPDGHAVDAAIAGTRLQVDDGSGKPPKTFAWEFEGPVDGRGTFCTPRVEERDAIPFVRTHFMIPR